MLEDMPRNYITIRDLIDDYRSLNDENSLKIIELLEHTQKFLTDTALDYQTERDQFIDETKINDILNDAAEGLNILHTFPKSELIKIKEVLVFCRLVILERLEELQEANDKIFTYYSQKDNALKSALIALDHYHFD